jgi:acetate kinase
MTSGDSMRLLTINTGSSSLKAALYHMDEAERRDLSAVVERIGLPGSRLHIADAGGTVLVERGGDLPDHGAAMRALLAWLRENRGGEGPDAVGHRVVHGGRAYSAPHLVSGELVAALRQLVPIDPDHLPQALDAIQAVGLAFPAVPQVACFDTAFHRHMPRVARMYALPRELGDAGIVRYGFHGLSYESIMHQLRAVDRAAAAGRVIVAHLGNGASMAAVRDGRGVDTTMGFTPSGGLVMGTRSGDLDPGVPLYLLQARGLDAAGLSALVNRQAGLLGASGLSADMRDLLDKEQDDPRAAEAVALFCYQARKFLGALAAALGGLDTLVFTGGIGEHAAPVRARICAGLDFLGIDLDPRRNAEHAPIISRDGARVTVRVMKTDEDLMIARHTQRLLAQRGARGAPHTRHARDL